MTDKAIYVAYVLYKTELGTQLLRYASELRQLLIQFHNDCITEDDINSMIDVAIKSLAAQSDKAYETGRNYGAKEQAVRDADAIDKAYETGQRDQALAVLEELAADADKEYSRSEIDNWLFSLGNLAHTKLLTLEAQKTKLQGGDT